MSNNKISINIDKEIIYKLMNDLNIKYESNLIDDNVENINIDNLEIDLSFKKKLEKYSKNCINIKEYKIVNIKSFYKDVEIEIFESKLGNIRINVEWLNVLSKLMNYLILDLIPRIYDNCNGIENVYPKSRNIFNWTFYNNPKDIKAIFLCDNNIFDKIENMTNFGFAIDPNIKPLNQIKILFNKMNIQLNTNKDFLEWYNNGNFYQYMKNVLFLNLGLTIGQNIKDLTINSHNKYWKQFIKKLICELNLNNDIYIICFGSESKLMFKNINFENIIFDIDPNVKNKPHNYNESPNYFYLLKNIFI